MAIDERELDDASLVEAAQGGDDQAFSELFRRHYPGVRRVCSGRVGSASDADELAQAAFVRAYERIDQCRGERRFGAWVQVIAYRLVADDRRRQSRSLLSFDPVGPETVPGGNQCEDAVLSAERTAEVKELLETLPPRQREVLVARDLEGRRPGEIATSLGLSLSAVDSLLLRARRRLASAWQAGHVEVGSSSVSVAGASAAATAVVADPGPLARAATSAADAIFSASVRAASALGLIPGASNGAHRLVRAAAVGTLAVAPAVQPLATSRPARAPMVSTIRPGAVDTHGAVAVPTDGAVPGPPTPPFLSPAPPVAPPTTALPLPLPVSDPEVADVAPAQAVTAPAVTGVGRAVQGTASAATGAGATVQKVVNGVTGPSGPVRALTGLTP
jgi:RNA polymerase sigma-70 factor (ECF subfamily)